MTKPRRSTTARLLALATAFLLVSLGASSAQGVDVDARTCQGQVRAVLRLDVDCAIEIKLGNAALESVPQPLQALASGLACRVPLKFRKAQVYGDWILDRETKLPEFNVTCALVSGSQADRFAATVQVQCTRSGGAEWDCRPFMQDVKGLGILGHQLENYVNTNVKLRSALTSALMPAAPNEQ